jgi:hypothetical membrane protein
LALHDCNSITNNGMTSLGGLRHLSSLSLRGCRKITNNGLEVLQVCALVLHAVGMYLGNAGSVQAVVAMFQGLVSVQHWQQQYALHCRADALMLLCAQVQCYKVTAAHLSCTMCIGP